QNAVLWQDCQPDNINYGSFGPYCVSVLEGNLFEPYYLFFGRGNTAPSYGYYFTFPFWFDTKDPVAEIRESKAEWKPEGVTFIAKWGNKLFVPKRAFIGGR